MNRATRAALVAASLLLPGSCLIARAGWIKAKGAVGEVLIRRALTATLQDGRTRRPWSWADMHPVARLRVPRLGIDRPVLSNASGSALAFGIGHVDGTASPGGAGHCVLAGHRDSWAAFLEDLRMGDELVVERFGGRAVYRVAERAVTRFDDARVLADVGDDRLTLVTCWPFRGWLHSPWRFVVSAGRVPEALESPASSIGTGSLEHVTHAFLACIGRLRARGDRLDARVAGGVGPPSRHGHDHRRDADPSWSASARQLVRFVPRSRQDGHRGDKDVRAGG